MVGLVLLEVAKYDIQQQHQDIQEHALFFHDQTVRPDHGADFLADGGVRQGRADGLQENLVHVQLVLTVETLGDVADLQTVLHDELGLEVFYYQHQNQRVQTFLPVNFEELLKLAFRTALRVGLDDQSQKRRKQSKVLHQRQLAFVELRLLCVDQKVVKQLH